MLKRFKQNKKYHLMKKNIHLQHFDEKKDLKLRGNSKIKKSKSFVMFY